jgi:hypothetical protein
MKRFFRTMSMSVSVMMLHGFLIFAAASVRAEESRELLVIRASQAIVRLESTQKTLAKVLQADPRPGDHAEQVEACRKASAKAGLEVGGLIAALKKGETVLSYPGLIALGTVQYFPVANAKNERRQIYMIQFLMGYYDAASGSMERRVYQLTFDGAGVITDHRVRPRIIE